MPTPSSRRVQMNTDDEINDRIHRQTQINIGYFKSHPQEIDQRLRELDREWDVERMLETGSSALSLTGLVLGIGYKRRWLLLPLVVQGFFMQHAMQGWCPPLPLFRRLGIRTVEEIDEERYALMAIRGENGGSGKSKNQMRSTVSTSK